MESGSVPVETRINAIVDYEVKKLSKKLHIMKRLQKNVELTTRLNGGAT